MTYHFATSANVPVPSSFTKQQLLEELHWFIPALVECMERMLSPGLGIIKSDPAGASQIAPQDSPLWAALDELYDYAVHGALPASGELDDGTLLDVDRFLCGLDGLDDFLSEAGGGIPRLAKATVALAKARQEFDQLDGERSISLDQVALLVRQPVEVVIRHFVVTADTELSVSRLREVLPAMFGYVPTGCRSAPRHDFIPGLSTELPIDVIRAINERAGTQGITPYEVLRTAFAHEIRGDDVRYPNFSRVVAELGLGATATLTVAAA